MLYEIELERRTRGLVHGPAVLSSSASTGLHLPLRETRGRIITDDPLSNSILPSPLPWLRTCKIIIRAREGGEVLWVRAFRSRIDAGIVWARLIGVDLEHARHLQVRFPTTWIQGELEYLFATVDTFTSVGSTTWTPRWHRCPGLGRLSGRRRRRRWRVQSGRRRWRRRVPHRDRARRRIRQDGDRRWRRRRRSECRIAVGQQGR